MDISEHMASIQNYEARMQMMMGLTEDALSFGTLNLSKNTFSVVHAQEVMTAITDRVNTMEELFHNTVSRVVGSKDQENYRKLFSRNNLISQMEKGKIGPMSRFSTS